MACLLPADWGAIAVDDVVWNQCAALAFHDGGAELDRLVFALVRFAAATRPTAGPGKACRRIDEWSFWAFFMVNGDPADAAVNLATGFAALVLLDWHFWKMGTAPDWWMRLRLLLSELTGLVRRRHPSKVMAVAPCC